MDIIYLDHNATTPMRPEASEAMARCAAAGYANPASQHRPGQRARRVLEDAREKIAAILGADLAAPRRDRLIFTSGGTEANNLAVLGIARACLKDQQVNNCHISEGDSPIFVERKSGQSPAHSFVDPKTPGGAPPGKIVASAGEHPSVLEPVEFLLEHGWQVDMLGLTSAGVVRVEQLTPLLDRKNVQLVSVQLANHETGVLQPVAELAEMCQAAGVPLHTDAIQAVGKMSVNFKELGVAAMSIAAHKFRGPLGIGALLLRDGIAIEPLLFGGHQQAGLRPGTESIALAVGMATALELFEKEHSELTRRLASLRNRFERGIRESLHSAIINGATAGRLPQTSNVTFPGIEGEVLRMALDLAGVACSVGSACSSGSTELSPTLRAMGLSGALASSSLRFSLGATTTDAEIDEAVRRIVHVCGELSTAGK
jgi:cysteine desulfurase